MSELRSLALPPKNRGGRPSLRTPAEQHARAAHYAGRHVAAAAERLFGPAPLPEGPPDVSETVRRLGDLARDLHRHPAGSPAHLLGSLLLEAGGACWAAVATGTADKLEDLLRTVRAHAKGVA